MRLIDADALIKNLKISEGMIANDGILYVPLADVETSIRNIPDVGAKPVKCAMWIPEEAKFQSRITRYRCSGCNSQATRLAGGYYFTSEYCPHCGAKMNLG